MNIRDMLYRQFIGGRMPEENRRPRIRADNDYFVGHSIGATSYRKVFERSYIARALARSLDFDAGRGLESMTSIPEVTSSSFSLPRILLRASPANGPGETQSHNIREI